MTATFSSLLPMTFIGGGNMAQALISGWLKQGISASQIHVVEPAAATREHLSQHLRVTCHEQATSALKASGMVVWAIKPQVFKQVALSLNGMFPQALHLSVAAGVRSDSIGRWLDTPSVVRAMPNTPALVGLGQTGLFAGPAVNALQREQVQALMQAVGQSIWVEREELLDAVTALSGSGPAYVFYFIEAMTKAGVSMGLTPEQAQQLAVGTFTGAAELARSSSESPEVLRERVTSKGGTTYAAITSMQEHQIERLIAQAMEAARQRSIEMGHLFDQA
jgi:pyrroline-5-carboxylate reductase